MFEHKKIFVLGMARSGYEAAKLLAQRKNHVLINDSKADQDSNHIEELKKLGVKVVLGEHPENLFTDQYDYLVKNPGIPNNHPYVLKAKEYNIPVINEVELAYQLMPENVTVIGVTGTNGKTTTTTLIYEILKQANKKAHLMGNIGFPVSSFIGKIQENEIAVMEISIQQLCNVDEFKTNISVLTNLYEAHLDFVGDYNSYMSLKKRIFNHHTKADYAVLNMDNKDVMNLTADINSAKAYFSSKQINDNGCCIKDGTIYHFNEKIIDLTEIRLKGMHNYENIMAAIAVVKKLDVSNDDIKAVLTTFLGVEHRIEFVRTINGREIYNDSKSTNVKATQIALSSFEQPTILLLGGLDRGHSFDELKSYLKNVKLIVTYGQTKERIKDFATSLNIECEVLDVLEEATLKAYQKSVAGDVILLSPACASWDQFKDFEERGRMFKQYVNDLK